MWLVALSGQTPTGYAISRAPPWERYPVRPGLLQGMGWGGGGPEVGFPDELSIAIRLYKRD